MENKKVGAVLVVGGGVGGIQAALDLAESGYKVYLIEGSPAIGGVMAQLDKTLPTNDCSMCILSPKLVECGRHLNIQTLSYSEVAEVQGEPGNFKALIRKRARYVDADKCTGCGECAEACPVEVESEFDEGLAKRKAIYRPYAQAFPNIFTIDKKDRAPCVHACPANVNAQGYIALIRQGKFQEAYDLVKEELPFPGILGRICPHPCETECRRASLDEPLAIADLKRFVADKVEGKSALPQVMDKKEEKVAIIGSGPAGLTAAYYLAKEGYQITIFEALPVLGGMLHVGIPEHRLPKKVLEDEIQDVKRLGVEIKTNTPIGKDLSLDELFQQGHKAIFISIGAHQSQKLRIPGEDSEGVVYGVDFLRDSNLRKEVKVGERVAVIGGGNVAIDASRAALRLGAQEVTILYRRSRVEMPASEEEIEEALTEGVRIEYLTVPTEVVSENGKVTEVKCIRMQLAEPDASGRRRPVPIPRSEFTIGTDMIIPAIGQTPDLSFLRDSGIETTKQGTIAADALTLATNRPGFFAGGDAQTGPGIAIEAVAAGKRAAESIRRYLNGEDLRQGRVLEREKPVNLRDIPPNEEKKPRERMSAISWEKRRDTFEEVKLGFTEEEAVKEASRCLNCGVCSECLQCVAACKAEAINHEMREELEEVKVGSVILAPGLDEFDPSSLLRYGYEKYPNVVTSIEFERILNASGPYKGKVLRPSDRKLPHKVAWIQCVGSRDESIGAGYCSSVCCTYAIKQAIIAKEHAGVDLDTAIFFMDMRLQGKGYEEYYNRAKEEHKVRFIRSRVYEIQEVDGAGSLSLRFAEENGTLHNEEFDLVVLSVGFRPSKKGMDLARRLGIELNKYGFCQTNEFTPTETSQPGIFVCGVFQSPKDIPETVMQGSAAAANSSALLSPARHSLVRAKEYPPEKDVTGEPPRIGVFVCHCGINIGGYVDVPEVVEYAKTLPNVAYAENNLYTCSQDTQARIKAMIEEHNLNRVIVASCTPRTHEPLFQETIKEAGLNRYLFEMANIRDQCSWVHMREPEKATQKAKSLVRMAIARAALLEPLHRVNLGLSHDALVIGGGIGGMAAALNLAEQGFKTYLVEREKELGGWARKIYIPLNGEKPQDFLHRLIENTMANPLIEVLSDTTVVKTEGFVGNFKTTLASENGQKQRLIEHGATIVATGAKEYRGSDFLLGQDKRVMTLSDLEEKLTYEPEEVTQAKDIAMILCVRPTGENHNYCSRVCCTAAIKNALKIKELNPEANIYILYKDIRTYGFKEELYTKARKAGILFIRYTDERPPQVQPANGKLEIDIFDPILDEGLILSPDLLVLATAMIPSEYNEELSRILKVPLTKEGFFHEAHVKLAPVDFASEGIFMCGIAHSPKFIDEAIIQAQAAAGRATTILAKERLEVGGAVCQVDPDKCTACLNCVRICPYAVPYINTKGVVEIEVAKCRGCGVCAAECPRKAIKLFHYNEEQMEAKIEALVTGVG